MSTLWTSARCDNLTYPSALLGTLQDIATYNRGTFPTACSSAGAWGAINNVGTPLGDIYGAKVAAKSVNSTFDDMNLFAGVTAPRSQLASPQKCAPGVPTGISIGGGGSPIPEIVCPNPGCVSNGASTPKCCDTSGGNCS